MKKTETYSFKAHQARFGTDQMCYDYLVQVKWNGVPTCPWCNNDNMNYYLKTRKTYKCSDCRKQFSLTRGTIFEKSKLPLTTWFEAIYWFTTGKRGVSSHQLAKWLGITQRSAWFIMHKLREALDKENEQNDILLSGIVEADETYIGPNINQDLRLCVVKTLHNAEQDRIHGLSKEAKRRRKGRPSKRGRKKGSTKKVLIRKKVELEKQGERNYFERNIVVFGMLERDGKIVLKKLGSSQKDVTKKNIYPHLKNHVNSKSILMTDQLNLYTGTKDLFAEHHSITHRRNFAKGNIHTNGIENVWKHLKKTIDGTFGHISDKHFSRYLNEYTFRWNRRKQSIQSHVDDIIPLLMGKKLTYKKLVFVEVENKLVA